MWCIEEDLQIIKPAYYKTYHKTLKEDMGKMTLKDIMGNINYIHSGFFSDVVSCRYKKYYGKDMSKEEETFYIKTEKLFFKKQIEEKVKRKQQEEINVKIIEHRA